MQAPNGRLVLSPSDLNDYVECPHLTTLALEVARGTRQRPHVPEDHGELLRRKGEEHEAAYLRTLRAAGRQVVDVIGADRWDFEASARATDEAMRAGAEIIYQATFVQGDWRGRADFLERVDQPTALGPWGYEALDAKLARAEKPTYVLQLCFYTEAIASIQQRHARRRCTSCSASASGARCATPTSPPTTGASAPGSSRRSAEARADRALPRRALRAVRVPPGVRRAMAAGGSPAAGGRDPARAGQPRCGRPGLHTLQQLAQAPPTRGPARRRPHVRDPSRPGRAAAPPAHHRRPRLARVAHRAGMRLRAAAAALAGRRHLRHRGRSVLGAGARPALPLRPADARGRRAGATRRSGRTTGQGSARRSSSWSTSSASGSRSTPTCTSTTTAPTSRRR